MNKTRRIINNLLNDIAGFFPYLFGFYIFSLIISFFSRPWKSFFNWNLFTLSIVVLGIATLSSKRLRPLRDLFSSKWKEKVSVQSVRGVISYVRNIDLSNIWDNLRSMIKWVRKIYLGIYKRIIYISKFFIKILIKIWRSLGIRGQIKTIIIISILAFSLVKSIGIIDFFVLAYALASILFIFESRISAVLAIILLIGCPIFLMFKKGDTAEVLAIYAYYFLVITVLTQIVEYVKEKKVIHINDEQR